MSGPKSSRYTLTAEQLKRILEEQERLRKEQEEKARKERESKEAKEYLASVKSKSKRFLSMVQEFEQKALSMKDAISTESQSRYQQLYDKGHELESVCRTTAKTNHSELMRARGLAEQLYDAIAAEGEGLIASTNEWILQQRIQNDEIISEGMQISFASVGLVEEPIDPIKVRVEAELEELLLLDIAETLRNELEHAIDQFKTIEDVNARSNFSAITLEPLKKRCVSNAKFRKTNAERYRNTYVRYLALCRQLEESEEVFEFTEEGLAALERAVSNYEQKVQRNAEQEYISRSVDEVLREMGYEVIGHRTVQKKSGKSFKSKLLTYDDGTVVNVTEASTGQITMEIGGMDDSDRLPDANERVALRKTMEAFCKDFKEIEHRLSERGVILDSRLSMAPPEEAYAQIINYNDYELVEDYQIVIAKKSRTTQSQKRKQMRND